MFCYNYNKNYFKKMYVKLLSNLLLLTLTQQLLF